MFFYVKNEKIYPAFILKYNSDREKQIIILKFNRKNCWM